MPWFQTWSIQRCFKPGFGMNNSQKPHAASASSYKKYSKIGAIAALQPSPHSA
jgi:hypothetical protein